MALIYAICYNSIYKEVFVVIQLKNVSKYYYSKGMIASGISKVNLTFDIGEFVVITGESGSAKQLFSMSFQGWIHMKKAKCI